MPLIWPLLDPRLSDCSILQCAELCRNHRERYRNPVTAARSSHPAGVGAERYGAAPPTVGGWLTHRCRCRGGVGQRGAGKEPAPASMNNDRTRSGRFGRCADRGELVPGLAGGEQATGPVGPGGDDGEGAFRLDLTGRPPQPALGEISEELPVSP